MLQKISSCDGHLSIDRKRDFAQWGLDLQKSIVA